MPAFASLDWEAIAPGQPLGPIAYELSLTRLVAFVRATGLYDYIHYDRDYARSVGMRDAFMATPHIIGLVSRLLTDWSGPDGQVRAIDLTLLAPCCRGDMLTVNGRVAGKRIAEDGSRLVDVDEIRVDHPQAAPAVAGSATLVFPPFPARAPAPPEPPSGETRPGLHDLAVPLTAHEMLLWCECLEDWNPLYSDAAFARSRGHPDIVAPPGLSWFFGRGSGVRAGVGHAKPGVDVPAPIRAGLTGPPLLRRLREGLMEANTPFILTDFPEAVVRTVADRYAKPLHPGMALCDTYERLSCSALQRTRLGEGHFVSFRHFFEDAAGDPIRDMTLTLFHFRPR